MAKRPVCVVVGVGPGNGAAFARRFDREGYAVALLARSEDFSAKLATELTEARAFPCDVGDPAAIARAFAAIRAQLGEPAVVVYNAGSGNFGVFDDIKPADLESSWRVNTLGLFAARSYIERRGMPATPEDLGHHTLIGYVPDLIVSPSLDYAAEFSAGWHSSFAISSAMGQAEAVRAGAGIGILHSFVARSMPELVPVEIVAPIRRAYWLVYHETVRPVRRVQLVSEFISRAVERERGRFV